MPELTNKCLAILARAPWPSKMFFTTLYPLFPWNQLSATDLMLAFGELFVCSIPSLTFIVIICILEA